MAYRLKNYRGQDVESALDKAAAGYRAGTGVKLVGNEFVIDEVWLDGIIDGLIPSGPISIPVESVSLNATDKNLASGSTFTLTVTTSPINPTNKSVTWSSSNDGVVKCASTSGTLDANGKCSVVVTAQKVSEDAIATVSVSCGGKTASCTFTVGAYISRPTSITLSTNTLSLNEGETKQLRVVSYLPSDANTDTEISWTSSDNSIAIVDSDGWVTAKTGFSTNKSCTITATTANGKTANCSVTVKSGTIGIDSVQITSPTSSITLNANDTYTFVAKVLPENTTMSKEIIWTSSNTNVATIDANGVLTAKELSSDGQTVITAKSSNGKTATLTVKVSKKVVETSSLSLSSASLSFKVGGATQRLTAARNSGANDNAQLIWSSSDTNVVTVAGNGTECIVEPVGVGSATIKVYVSGKENVVYATCPVSVAEDVVVGNVLIGEIRLGAPLADGVDASDVANILTDELIQKNINEGFLFEKNYSPFVSTLRSSTETNGYFAYDYSTFNYFLPLVDEKTDWGGYAGKYAYQLIMIPESLSSTYIGAWGNDITMTGASFSARQAGKVGVDNKELTFNGLKYHVFGYYTASKNVSGYCLTLIKK